MKPLSTLVPNLGSSLQSGVLEGGQGITLKHALGCNVASARVYCAEGFSMCEIAC